MFALGISDFSIGEGVYPAAQLLRLKDARQWVPDQVERAGKALGFVLDAEVRVSADTIRP